MLELFRDSVLSILMTRAFFWWLNESVVLGWAGNFALCRPRSDARRSLSRRNDGWRHLTRQHAIFSSML